MRAAARLHTARLTRVWKGRIAGDGGLAALRDYLQAKTADMPSLFAIPFAVCTAAPTVAAAKSQRSDLGSECGREVTTRNNRDAIEIEGFPPQKRTPSSLRTWGLIQ
jgi:hypothetical protein